MSTDDSKSQPKVQSKAIRRPWLLVGTFLAALAIIFAVHYWPPAGRSFADQAMEFERNKRYAMWRAGFSMPGTPNLSNLDDRLKDHGVKLGAPVFVRIFKRDFELLPRPFWRLLCRH